MNPTKRTQLRRLPNRGSYDAEAIHAILDAAFLAHVGFQVDGQPLIIPTLYGREEDKLYLHGSAASRMLRELETGVPACVCVTIVDGLVLARSAFHHSMNYRSVVAFGTARKLEDAEQKTRALRIISEHLIAGRWEDVRKPTAKELKATAVLEFRSKKPRRKSAQVRRWMMRRITLCRSGPAFCLCGWRSKRQYRIRGWQRMRSCRGTSWSAAMIIESGMT